MSAQTIDYSYAVTPRSATARLVLVGRIEAGVWITHAAESVVDDAAEGRRSWIAARAAQYRRHDAFSLRAWWATEVGRPGDGAAVDDLAERLAVVDWQAEHATTPDELAGPSFDSWRHRTALLAD